MDEELGNLYGALKGTVEIVGDIIAPIDEKWDVESDNADDIKMD